MKPVLDWIKASVLIVVLGVVAMGALGLGWYFSGSLNASVKEEAQARAAKMTELAALEKSSVALNIPGREPQSKTLVVNQQILDQYKEATEKLKADADQIRKLAIERNKGDHTVLLDRVFPAPPANERETTPRRMHKALVDAYGQLLTQVNAGMPPSNAQVGADLARREVQFVQSTLKKASREALDEREKEDLTEELTRSRLAIYGEQAQKVTFYGSMQSIDVPPSPEGKSLPALAELCDWQWRYWITRDILRSIADASAAANGGTPGSVLRSPVKRLLSIRIDEPNFPTKRSSASGGGAVGGGFGGSTLGTGSVNAPDGSEVPADAGAAVVAPAADGSLGAPQIDTTTEAARSFARSFTGRQSSSVYDVRRVEVRLIAATSQLPVIFDALAKRNFITVVDVAVQPADAFAAASVGFVYGREPVSNVKMVLETVWLREWTAPFMPAEVRTALGIPTQGAAPAADGQASGSAG